jgi:DMSO/TMAO reductase YedYZ molybdopterin-dependent catalytic subunit
MTDDSLNAMRRKLLGGTVAAVSTALSGCERIATSPSVNSTLAATDSLTFYVQRLLLGRSALAREYPASAISRDFRANGTTRPDSGSYLQHATEAFRNWRLEVGGLVDTPLSLSLDELRAMPSRSQITRHDCVEGWSSIGQWRGARLSALLERAGVKPEARYVAFFCADTLELTLDGTGDYYETIDLVDALHEQTILAYEMNEQPLPVAHGAPVRLRVERQLGYKMAKYVMRIELIDSFAQLGRGKGGYWEDRGYQWYAGI